MYFRRELGIHGENLACKYLQNNNYKIIKRNFLCRQGEVDIIAYDINKKELVFIEVKTRSNSKFGYPIEAVNKNKQKHMKQVIRYYIYKNHIIDVSIRIDVIEVYIQNQNLKINHIKQVL